MCVQPRRVDRRKCRQQARPSTSFVDKTIDLPWRNFRSPEFETKFQGAEPYFLEEPEFFTTRCRTDGRNPPSKNQLDSSSCFNTLPACDGQTQDEGTYRASTASSGKKESQLKNTNWQHSFLSAGRHQAQLLCC